MDFPTRLRELRLSRKKTQQQLATALGLTEGAYRAYESGRSSPTPEQIKVICTALGVTLTEFFSGVDVDTSEDFDMLRNGTIVPPGSADRPLADEICRDIYLLTDEQLRVVRAMVKAMKEENTSPPG